MNFTKLFRQISTEEIFEHGNLFTMVGKEFFAITAGTEDHYNSMVGSGGGFGMLFRKPTAWCVLRADRYTLELIEKNRAFTLSYFADDHREQMLFLGSKSGRDSCKMEESLLTGITTPSGNISFKESRLVIECSLTEITTPAPDDFYTEETREYFSKAYREAGEYRKYIFGEITAAWIRIK